MDTEVSDLPEYGGELIEIALLKVQLPNFTISQQFSTRIKPKDSMRDEVIAITGISNEDLASSPSFKDTYKPICSLFEDTQIITKLVDFELAAVNNSFEVNDIKYNVDPNKFVELKEIESKLGLKKHDNEFVAKSLGIKCGEAPFDNVYMYMEIYKLAFQNGLLA